MFIIHIHHIEEVCFPCLQISNTCVFVFLSGALIAVEVFDDHVIGVEFNLFTIV